MDVVNFGPDLEFWTRFRRPDLGRLRLLDPRRGGSCPGT